jgi:hypothetical protein
MRFTVERVADAELGWVLPTTDGPVAAAPPHTIIPVKEKIVIAEKPGSH